MLKFLEILFPISPTKCLVAFIGLYVIRRLVQWWLNPLRKLPGPPGLPILGNSLDYSQDLDTHKLLVERARTYGPIYKDYVVFGGHTVHITDPKIAKEVLVTKCTNYIRTDFAKKMVPAFGKGVLTTKGKLHALQRKQLNPEFSLVKIKQYLQIFNEKANQLIMVFKDKIKENKDKPINTIISDQFTQLTLDVIGLCAFGYSFNCITGGHTEESLATDKILTGSTDMVRHSYEQIFPFLRLFPSKAREKVKEAEKIFFGLINKVIRLRREEWLDSETKTERRDLLNVLMKLDDENGEKIDDKTLFNHVFTFMIAGHETTSIAMTWTIFFLAKFPDIQQKAQEEIDNTIGDASEVSWNDLEKLKYLECCIKEALRLYPISSYLSRESINEDKLGPYTIPARTRLSVDVSAIQRNDTAWKDPSVFKPERFQSIDVKKNPMFIYQFLPFSRGPRMCIGYRFAQVELKVVLALILKSFTFRLGKEQPSEIETREYLTLKPFPSPVIQVSVRHS